MRIILGLVCLALPMIMSAPLLAEDKTPLSFEAAVQKFQNHAEAIEVSHKNNKPFLLSHGKKTRLSVLILHGLQHGPNHVREIADFFFKEGYNVVVPLLSGHGTKPADLITVKASDWEADFYRAYEIAKAVGEQQVVAGLSVGASILIDRSYYHGFAGVVLFSPAIGMQNSAAPLAGYLKRLKDYAEDVPEQFDLYYEKMTLNSIEQVMKLAKTTGSRYRLWNGRFYHPVFLVYSKADAVLDMDRLKVLQEYTEKKDNSEVIVYEEDLGIAHSGVIYGKPYINEKNYNVEFEQMKSKLSLWLKRLP